MYRSFSVTFFYLCIFLCISRRVVFLWTFSPILGQGNIFASVCHSVHGGGVCVSACWESRPPEADPPGQTPPGTRHPPRCRHPPTQCMLGDKANTRAVRILLECILVHIIFGLNYITSFAIQMHISNKRIGPIVSSNLVLFSK